MKTFSFHIIGRRLLLTGAVASLGFVLATSPVHARRGDGPGAQRQGLHQLAQQLQLSEDQKQKLQPILQAHHERMKALRGDTSLSQEGRRAQAKANLEQLKAQVSPILTPRQLATAQGFFEQRAQARRDGKGGPVRQAMQQLNLTEDQKTRLREVMQGKRQQFQAQRREMKNLPREERQAKREAMRQEMETTLASVLTPDQLSQFRTLMQQARQQRGRGQGQGPKEF